MTGPSGPVFVCSEAQRLDRPTHTQPGQPGFVGRRNAWIKRKSGAAVQALSANIARLNREAQPTSVGRRRNTGSNFDDVVKQNAANAGIAELFGNRQRQQVRNNG